MTNNSTFETLQETSTYIGFHGCEICGREVSAIEVCSGCQQWVEHYAEMLPLSREMSADLQ
jgi:hypothetical protein